MNKGPATSADDDLELSLETLDQWETDLDQFAASIMQRLSNITGEAIDTSGLIPDPPTEPKYDPSADHSDQDSTDQASDDPDALQLLQTLREMTQ